MRAYRTGELIDIILKEAPAPAVGGLAVVAQGAAVLCDRHAQIQEALVVLGGQELHKHGLLLEFRTPADALPL